MGWMNYLIGVEREGLRIRHNGKLAETPHPSEFGDRLENPLIGTDFGDAMLELRTYPQENAESCYRELLAVTRKALKLLYEKEELLWPYSLPYELPDEAHFPYNPYPGRPDLEEHERLISKIYGLRRNCICGIHVNFSISDAMFAKMRSEYPSVPSDKDEAYLKCARQVLQHEAALRYFFDASPTDYAYHLIQENSWRNGPEGFRNEKAKMLDYCSMTAYLQSLKQTASYERLSAVRLKSKDKESFDEGIAQHGVERIEFRLCDIDPFDICGISLYEMELVVAVLFSCMVTDAFPNDPAGVLSVCADTDRRLRLGLKRSIRFYREQEAAGCKKSERVRNLFRENGAEGLLELALQYGKQCSENR